MPVTATVNGIAVSNKANHSPASPSPSKTPAASPARSPATRSRGPAARRPSASRAPNFVVAPGREEVRAIRVHASDGDITVLITPDGAKVDLESSCG